MSEFKGNEQRKNILKRFCFGIKRRRVMQKGKEGNKG